MVGDVIVKFELFLTPIFEFLRFIHGGHFEFQVNLEKITCTFPYRGECNSKI